MAFSNEPVKIVIIDSGIDTSIFDLKKYVKKEIGFILDAETGEVRRILGLPVSHSHGTGVALIIRHICKNVELISMNILDKNLKSDGRILLHALKEAVKIKPDVIHMSLGTTKWRYRWALRNTVQQATNNNTLVVAAVQNRGKSSYPAHTKNVIAVKGAFFEDPMQYGYDNGIYYAQPNASSIEGIENIPEGIHGNSAAAAYITGHLAHIKNDYLERQGIPFIQAQQIKELLFKKRLEKPKQHFLARMFF